MDPILYYNNNLVSTLNLIYVMKKYKCKNIIFSSSATVYGNASVPYNESSTVGIGLTNPYGKTKYMQEEILRDLYVSDNSWSIVILRYFNPISQKNNSLREKTNDIPNNLFPYLVKVHNKEMDILNIYGNKYNTTDGTCIRDFIHVLDLADSHIQLCDYIVMNQPHNIGLKTYNVGTGKGISVKQLIDAFEKENNTKLNYQFVGRREGDLEISYADVYLIYKDIGWKTKYEIKDMVKL
jgi:UDP-glucose 4-epimerase